MHGDRTGGGPRRRTNELAGRYRDPDRGVVVVLEWVPENGVYLVYEPHPRGEQRSLSPDEARRAVERGELVPDARGEGAVPDARGEGSVGHEFDFTGGGF